MQVALAKNRAESLRSRSGSEVNDTSGPGTIEPALIPVVLVDPEQAQENIAYARALNSEVSRIHPHLPFLHAELLAL